MTGWGGEAGFAPQPFYLQVTVRLIIASGGPAGGQIFEKFDKQVFKIFFSIQRFRQCMGLRLYALARALPFSPVGAEGKSSGNRKVFAELFSKSDPPEA